MVFFYYKYTTIMSKCFVMKNLFNYDPVLSIPLNFPKDMDPVYITDSQEKDTFRVMKGLNLLKAVTLSPYLSTCQKEAGIEPTANQYI